MSRDTTWEDVWAEYDARQAGHAAPPAAVATPAIAVPRHRPVGLPRRLVVGGLLAVLVLLLGLPLGDAGAPAVASQELAQQRRDLVVVGLAGETEMAESPAGPPPEAVLLSEAAMLPMPPPAWVQPSLVPATAVAAPAVAPETRRTASSPRRQARANRPLQQVAAAEQPWFDGSASLQQRRTPTRSRAIVPSS
jgi:hypothetical protein